MRQIFVLFVIIPNYKETQVLVFLTWLKNYVLWKNMLWVLDEHYNIIYVGYLNWIQLGVYVYILYWE